MNLIKEKQNKAYGALKEKLSLKNAMQAPKLKKVVVSAGFGSAKDKKRSEVILDRLTKITGQHPALRSAKKSIASFKLRQGDPVGYVVTLRGARMEGFINKLLNIAFPRTRDFRGVSRNSVDDMGNMTLGIKEHTIFPEVTDEELKDVFGMGITVETSAKNKEDAIAFLEYMEFPFKKDEEVKKSRKKK
jgi:large subunit ribosomal protein L5